MRIAGITISDNKQLPYALTAIYGVGQSRARAVLTQIGIDAHKYPKELTQDEEHALRQAVESYRIEGELRREISTHIKRLKDIKSYRGSRHSKRLPARGQRTRTNARTLKGVRKTMGSGRRTTEKT
jgi:small subunit ribosomal protein S13